MKAIFEKVNGFVKELGIFLGVVGLGVAGQIVLGDKVGLDVIGNLQGIVDGFVEGASLAGLITLLVVLALIAGDKE